MNLLSVGKSSSFVLSASSIVTIKGKCDAKEEALSRAERRTEAFETATSLLNKPSAFSVRNFAVSLKVSGELGGNLS
jgi:hypothetical protein